MENYFDQFDSPTAAGGGNYFDQFDKPQAAPQPSQRSQGGGGNTFGGIAPFIAGLASGRPQGLKIGGYTPSLSDIPSAAGAIAKNFWGGLKAPGDIINADIAPRTPGILTEEDQFRLNSLQDALPNKGSQAASAIMTGAIPGGFFGAPRGALGMGMTRPGTMTGTPINAAEAPLNPAASAEQMVAKAGDVQNATGVPISIPRYLVDPNRATQGMAEGLKNIPGVGDKIAASAKATQEALGNAVGKVQEGFGGGLAADAGSVAKDALENWIGPGSRKVANRVYDVVDQHIDPAVKTDLSATTKAAQNILDRRATSKIPGESGAVNLVKDAIETPGGLTYDGIKGLRSYVGDLTSQELVSKGLNAQEKDALYGALTQDLRSATLNAGGPQALTAFNKANDVFKAIVERRDAVTKLLGTTGNASPEQVVTRIMSMAGTKSTADIGRLMQARKAMGPEAWNEVASSVIAKLGRDPAGQFSIQRFLGPNGYNGLSPAGRSALFKTTGKDSLGKSLDDIAYLSKEIQGRLDQYAKNPGTARSLIATLGIYGVLHHPIAVLSTTIAGNRLASLVTEPATARMTADWMKAYRNAIAAPNAGSSRAVREAANKLAGILAPQGADPAMIASRLIPGAAIAPQPPQ